MSGSSARHLVIARSLSADPQPRGPPCPFRPPRATARPARPAQLEGASARARWNGQLRRVRDVSAAMSRVRDREPLRRTLEDAARVEIADLTLASLYMGALELAPGTPQRKAADTRRPLAA